MDLYENSREREQVEKREAGERLFRSAALLFFQRQDPICVHALGFAANQIFSDILFHLHGEPPFDEEWIRDERLSEWRRRKREAANFFKHADRDPQGVLSFDPAQNEHLLFEAVVHYYKITKDTPQVRIASMAIYLYAFNARHPELLKPGTWRDNAEEESFFAYRSDSFDRYAAEIKRRDPGKNYSEVYVVQSNIVIPGKNEA